MTPLDRKRRLRREALARRAEARGRGHPEPAALLAPTLARLLDERGGLVAAYLPLGSEIDPGPALEAAAPPPWLLPVMAEGPGRPLSFRPWRPGEPLVPGGFGTRVPERGPFLLPDLLVVPLVAFDRRGNRLGYGGGFYDRTLSALRRQGRRPFALGFAWAAQEVDDVPTEPTDVRLDLVVTEREVIAPWHAAIARPKGAP